MGRFTHWEIIGNRSVKAIGGVNTVYAHYCPLKDFLLIAEIIQKKLENQSLITTAEILRDLRNVRMARGNLFQKRGHQYKVLLTLFVLIKEGFLEKTEKGKYVLKKNDTKLGNWIKKLRG